MTQRRVKPPSHGAERGPRRTAPPRGSTSTAGAASQRAELPNGLRVLTAAAPGLHSAMVALYVRAGSRHESASVNGVSHFLEHLLFRGSVGWPDSVAMNAAIESAGGNLNGVTARDHGAYYTPLHPTELGTGLSVLGDIVRRPLLKEIEIEREVILEEILDEVDVDGRDIDPDNLVKRLVFGDHPLARKIGGTRASVRGMARRHARAHLERFYTGENLVLAVAGPVPTPRCWSSRRRLGELPRGAAQPRPPRPGRPAPRCSSWWTTTTPRPSSRWPSPARPSATPTTRPSCCCGGCSTTACRPGCRSRWWRSAAWPTRSTAASTPSSTPGCW